MKDLTKGSILNNIVKLSLPIMFSNFMQTVYNLTDAFWLGKLPEAREAISVVGIAFQLVFFLSSFGTGFIVAGTSLVARVKGSGEKTLSIKDITAQFIVIFLIFSLLFISISTIFMEPVLTALNTPEEILNDSMDYIKIIVFGMALMYFFQFYQAISFGLGDSINPMKIQIVSILLNIIIDPIFIFGFESIPSMEIIGAAYATLLSRFIAVLLAIILFSRKYNTYLPEFRGLIPDKKILKEILQIAIPESISRSMSSFGFFILQGFVNSFGTVVISVYSLGLRVTNLFLMPALGISSALTSILGQNLGANKMDRVFKSIKVSFWLVNIIMFIGCICLIFAGGSLVALFINDSEVIYEAVRMYRITAFATFMFGMIFTFNGIFNAIGKTKYNLILSLIRLWVLRIPFTYILSNHIEPYPHEALWWAMIISNGVNLISAVIIYRSIKWNSIVSNNY